MKAARVQFVPQLHHCIAEYNSHDTLVGGVLYTDWNFGSVLMHFALFSNKCFLGRQLIWLSFQYPFIQLGVKKIVGLVPEWNIPSRNMALKAGFKIEYKIDDIFNNPPPIDNGMYIMSMKKEDCEWLKMKPPHIDFASSERTNKLPVMVAMGAPTTATIH
jgi:hypothetical protein